MPRKKILLNFSVLISFAVNCKILKAYIWFQFAHLALKTDQPIDQCHLEMKCLSTSFSGEQILKTFMSVNHRKLLRHILILFPKTQLLLRYVLRYSIILKYKTSYKAWCLFSCLIEIGQLVYMYIEWCSCGCVFLSWCKLKIWEYKLYE